MKYGETCYSISQIGVFKKDKFTTSTIRVLLFLSPFMTFSPNEGGLGSFDETIVW